jgi:hypothetical protein
MSMVRCRKHRGKSSVRGAVDATLEKKRNKQKEGLGVGTELRGGVVGVFTEGA